MAREPDPKSKPDSVTNPTPSWDSEEWRRMQQANADLQRENAALRAQAAADAAMRPRPTSSGQPPFRLKEGA